MAERLVIERELRYVMRLAALKNELDLSSFPSRLIEQHYFPRRFFPHLARHLRDIVSSDLYEFLREELTVARLRKVKKDGKAPQYILDLKGAKEATAIGKTERPELEAIKLSKPDFYRLLPFAIAGSTRKRRYVVKGEVLDFKQQAHRVRAQIDVWKRAKCWRKFQRDPSRRLDVVTIDVELERRDLVVMLRAGNASFHFLYLAKELTALPPQIQFALSNRRLARRGFDHFARKTIRGLLGKRRQQREVLLSLVPPYKPL